jgi:hypothetical protein
MIYNLILAVLWLLLGLALLVGHVLFTEHAFRASVLGVPAGWLALVLAAYNLLRWWVHYAARRRPPPALISRPRPAREPAPRVPDPTFDFTDPSPGGEAGAPP